MAGSSRTESFTFFMTATGGFTPCGWQLHLRGGKEREGESMAEQIGRELKRRGLTEQVEVGGARSSTGGEEARVHR